MIVMVMMMLVAMMMLLVVTIDVDDDDVDGNDNRNDYDNLDFFVRQAHPSLKGATAKPEDKARREMFFCFLFCSHYKFSNLKTCYCRRSVPRSTLRPISRQETVEVGPGGDDPCQGMLIFKRAKNIDKLPNKLLAQKISKMVGTTRVKTSTHATFDNHRLTGLTL